MTAKISIEELEASERRFAAMKRKDTIRQLRKDGYLKDNKTKTVSSHSQQSKQLVEHVKQQVAASRKSAVAQPAKDNAEQKYYSILKSGDNNLAVEIVKFLESGNVLAAGIGPDGKRLNDLIFPLNLKSFDTLFESIAALINFSEKANIEILRKQNPKTREDYVADIRTKLAASTAK